jgi:hypothetical protein
MRACETPSQAARGRLGPVSNDEHERLVRVVVSNVNDDGQRPRPPGLA